MEKGIDATSSRQFAAVQAPGIYCRKMRCSTVPETDRPICHKSFLHPRLLSAQYLVMRMTHNSEA